MRQKIEGLDILAEEFAEFQLKSIEVPLEIKILNWPKVINRVEIELRKKNYVLLCQSAKTGMWSLIKRRGTLDFVIYSDGTFVFIFDFEKGGGLFYPILVSKSVNSGSDSDFERMQALVLFHQFKNELILKIVQNFKDGLGKHNQAVAMVEEAIERFI